MRPSVHSKTHQKVISTFLVICFIVTPLMTFFALPKKAEAICSPFAVPPVPSPFSVPVHDDATSPKKQADAVMQGNIFFKNCILDGIAILLAKTIIKQLTKSIVDWINSGFKGNPSFVQNTGKFFGSIADTVAGQVIEGIAPFLCSPFKLNIQLALALNQMSDSNDVSCTLSNAEKNFSDFLSKGISINGTDVSGQAGGSWSNWFDVTQNPQNNPYGAMMIAQAKLTTSVGTAQGKYQQQLDWGRGFLSFESCPPNPEIGGFHDNTAPGSVPAGGIQPGDGSGNVVTFANPLNTPDNSSNSLASIGSLGLLDSIFGDGSQNNALAQTHINSYEENTNRIETTNPSGARPGNQNTYNTGQGVQVTNGVTYNPTLHTDPLNPTSRALYDANGQLRYGIEAGNNGCVTKTPGAVVESQLENFLGSDLRGLEIAQSIDQIVAALVGQLISQTLGGFQGLAGASGGGGSSGGGSDYLNSILKMNKAAKISLPIVGSCVVSTENAGIGDVVTWTAYAPSINGNVTYSWSGTDNLSGSGDTATTSYSTPGEKTASVTITSTGKTTQNTDGTPDTEGTQSAVLDCMPGVIIGGISNGDSGPSISCGADLPMVSVSNPTPVTWLAVVIGGLPPFRYVWQGDDGLTGSEQAVIKTYTIASAVPKAATVQVIDAEGHTYSHECYSQVLVTP